MSLFNPYGFLVPSHRFRDLLRAGAEPNEIWRSGPGQAYDVRMPLLEAAKSMDGLVYLRLLLSDPRTDLCAGDLQGRTALHLATAHEQIDAMGLLLAAGADPHLRDGSGRTPLHYACQTVDDRPMRLLLEAGVDPDAVNAEGRAALHETMTCWTSWPKPLESKVALLLAAGASVNQRGPQDMTPLYYAACAGWARLTAMLLAKGADPNLRTENGERPVDAVLRQLAVGPGRNEPALRDTLAVLLDHDRQRLMACVAQVGERMRSRASAM